jgi:hypothetical protein
MKQQWSPATADGTKQRITVGATVRTYPGTSREVRGLVVEDFGELSGQAVVIGDHHIVDAARRWAVQLYDGSLVFVDDADIAPG